MNIEAAKQIFEEIVDICYQTENQQLIETVNQIYQDVQNSSEISHIIASAEELQITLNETDFLPEEEDDIQEMHKKIEKLSE